MREGNTDVFDRSECEISSTGACGHQPRWWWRPEGFGSQISALLGGGTGLAQALEILCGAMKKWHCWNIVSRTKQIVYKVLNHCHSHRNHLVPRDNAGDLEGNIAIRAETGHWAFLIYIPVKLL